EAHVLMLSTNNSFSSANGRPIMPPSQGIVLRLLYRTCEHAAVDPDPNHTRPAHSDEHEAMLAYAQGKVSIHEKIRCRIKREKVIPSQKSAAEAVPPNRTVTTTVGRLIFNDILPVEMPLYNFPLSQKGAGRVIADCHRLLGRSATIEVLDKIKETGFRWSTLAGLSFGIHDLRVPADKTKIIGTAQKVVDKIEKGYQQGAITPMERHNQLIDVWVHARERVTEAMMAELKADRRDEKGNYVLVG